MAFYHDCGCHSGFHIPVHVHGEAAGNNVYGSVDNQRRPLGDIGAGVVKLSWLWNGNSRKAVILKYLRPRVNVDNEKLAERFLRECQVWGTMCHPNVAPMLGIWRDQTQASMPAFVSPYYRNGDLGSLLRAYRTSLDGTLPSRIHVIRCIRNGLQYLHYRKVVHADLHPTNIMIDDEWRPRILDFGCAKILDEKGFTTASTICPSRYAAPEAGTKEERDYAESEGRSRGRGSTKGDVWAFGMLALLVLGGDEPFYNIHDDKDVRKAITGYRRVRPVKEMYADMPHSVWDMLSSCWATRPGERPTIHSIAI